MHLIELMDYCTSLEVDFAEFIAAFAVEMRELRGKLNHNPKASKDMGGA